MKTVAHPIDAKLGARKSHQDGAQALTWPLRSPAGKAALVVTTPWSRASTSPFSSQASTLPTSPYIPSWSLGPSTYIKTWPWSILISSGQWFTTVIKIGESHEVGHVLIEIGLCHWCHIGVDLAIPTFPEELESTYLKGLVPSPVMTSSVRSEGILQTDVEMNWSTSTKNRLPGLAEPLPWAEPANLSCPPKISPWRAALVH